MLFTVGQTVAVAVLCCPYCTHSIVTRIANGLYRTAGIIGTCTIGMLLPIGQTIAITVSIGPDRVGRIVGITAEVGTAREQLATTAIRITRIKRSRINTVNDTIAIGIRIVRIRTADKFLRVGKAVIITISSGPDSISGNIAGIPTLLQGTARIKRITRYLFLQFRSVNDTVAVRIFIIRIRTFFEFLCIGKSVVITICSSPYSIGCHIAIVARHLLGITWIEWIRDIKILGTIRNTIAICIGIFRICTYLFLLPVCQSVHIAINCRIEIRNLYR